MWFGGGGGFQVTLAEVGDVDHCETGVDAEVLWMRGEGAHKRVGMRTRSVARSISLLVICCRFYAAVTSLKPSRSLCLSPGNQVHLYHMLLLMY